MEFDDGLETQRWVSYEHHGELVPTHEDATLPLLQLAEGTAADGLIDLLGDMGIAGVGISRWALMSAPSSTFRALVRPGSRLMTMGVTQVPCER